jgi:hypothetical protein
MELVHGASGPVSPRCCAPGSYPFGGLLIWVVGHGLNDPEQRGMGNGGKRWHDWDARH